MLSLHLFPSERICDCKRQSCDSSSAPSLKERELSPEGTALPRVTQCGQGSRGLNPPRQLNEEASLRPSLAAAPGQELHTPVGPVLPAVPLWWGRGWQLEFKPGRTQHPVTGSEAGQGTGAEG